MASTISLSDPISTLVTKTNTLIGEVGQKSSLTTSNTTDLVAAINEINAKIVDIDTNAEIAAKVESYFSGNQLDVGGINADSADFDSASITTLTSVNGVINNATLGQVTIDSASISAGVATLASAQITNATLTTATVTSATVTTLNMESVALDNIKPFQIYNSAGSVVLAGYLLSTSNNAGTL